MSVRSLETTIWHECQALHKNPKMKKDLFEWNTGELTPAQGKISVHIPS